jgi:diketogulonate reductase-like aldo/keto reductase
MITRRSMMKMLAGAGAAMMSSTIGAQRSTSAGLIRRAIPSSGEQIPVIGLGTYQAFDAGSDAPVREPLKQVLRDLVAKGGSVVDSSPMYGRAEAMVGELSSELALRPKLFLATKVWATGKEAGMQQMEDSFRLMHTRTMDLMQIHNLVDWRTHTTTLQDWKQQRRVRYIGITHYHSGAYDELERLIKTRAYDFVQLNYSIAEREAERTVLPLAQQTGVAVIANRPFAQSALFSRTRGKQLPPWAAEFDCTSWAQFFLKYIVSHPAITCAIPATNKPEHMVDNMGACYGRLPDEQTRRKMVQLVAAL